MDIKPNLKEIRKIVRKHGVYTMRKLFDDQVTGLITKKRVPSCILCGSEKKITKEHVLPKWAFDSDAKRSFTSDVNQLPQFFIGATIPACQSCNSELLNSLERYIQQTLEKVNLETSFYSDNEWENIIRWLEILDFKFQVWDIMAKFIKHKNANYIPDLSDFSIAFMREFSVRSVTSKTRAALKRIARKDKTKRLNALIVGRTIKPTSHYFHKSGQFIYLEIPAYNKMFFYFYEKEFTSDKIAHKEAMKIIKTVYNV
jgi:hypothetical protein